MSRSGKRQQHGQRFQTYQLPRSTLRDFVATAEFKLVNLTEHDLMIRDMHWGQ